MAPFQLDATLGLGVTEMGIFATLILFGILILQVYIYYLRTSDRALVRILVALVFIFETCHTVAVTQAIYYWTVTLANVAEKPGTVRGLSFGMVFETLITFLVQSYFIHRVYRFSQNAWIGGIIGMLCLLRFGGGIVLSVGSFMNLPHEPDYFSLQERLGWLVTATFSIGASVDVFVAISLCVYLQRWKSPPAMKTTSQLIHRIMFWSIQTGLVTSVVSVTVVVCFQAMRHNYIWIGVFAILGKLYSNSLLASLNIRTLHRKADAYTRNSFAIFSDGSMDGVGQRSAVDVEFAPGSTIPFSSTRSAAGDSPSQYATSDSEANVLSDLHIGSSTTSGDSEEGLESKVPDT
ncbi:hypothetical protein B0H11DRAFT_2416082 [Mycena galericulata]|nr:hypothetical protein B0H11DRAFT_2435368 [Mycena galericulata]KAJ7483933.1 hypothetical protein B0H11DRAFT_2416082 [Mycena galericulata]